MFKKFTSLSHWNLDLMLLLLRVVFGMSMMTHGYSKIQRYEALQDSFANYLGIGSEPTLILVIFAEFVCAGLVVIGALSRLAAIPMFVTMFVAFFVAHADDPFQKKELALVFMTLSVVIFFLGSGKYSIDRLLKK